MPKASEQPPVPPAPQPPQLTDPEIAALLRLANDVDGSDPYVIKAWHGHENYCCKFCAWAYLDDPLEALMHYHKMHLVLDLTGAWLKINRTTPADQVASYTPEAGE